MDIADELDDLSSGPSHVINATGRQGAEEIRRLRARVQQLEGDNKGLVLKNALLRQRPDLPVDRIPAAKEVDKLRKALRPFAEAARMFDPDIIGGTTPKTGPWHTWWKTIGGKPVKVELTVEHLREARKLTSGA